MRLNKLQIDGFGRFVEQEVDLAPGLQVIAGPNEHGKSTIRHFIADMLYGQKKSTSRRLYEDGAELRVPWHSQNGYGGRLTYTLDTGETIEVQRSFHPDSEFIKIFDRTHGEDITDRFPMLKNRESTFAEKQIHMTKAVFNSVATISHFSLTNLGDKKALMQIREKLLSLTDTASDDHSAEDAIANLRHRMTTIGQAQARTKPLPKLKQLLSDLQYEYQDAYEAAREVAVYERRRATVLDEIGALRNRRARLEEQLAKRTRAEQFVLLEKADALTGRIKAVHDELATLGDLSNFPLDRVDEVRRMNTIIRRSEESREEAQARLDALVKERDDAVAALEAEGVPFMKEADPETENVLADFDREIGRCKDRIEQLEETATRAENLLEEADAALVELPDFGSLNADPVQHLTGLASDYEVAERTAREASQRVEHAMQRAADLDVALESRREMYAEFENFVGDLRDHEANRHSSSAAARDRERERVRASQEAEDLAGRFPGMLVMAVLGAAFAAVTIVIAIVRENSGFFLAAGVGAVMLLYFSGACVGNRRRMRAVQDHLLGLGDEEANLAEERDSFRELMEKAECETFRELEAHHETYRREEQRLEALRSQIDEMREAIGPAEAALETARRELCQALLRAGESVDGELDVDALVSRALTRYQSYRDAKRRQSEAAEAKQRTEQELADVKAELDSLREKDIEVSLAVRQFLRDNHYPEEAKHDSALKALRAYRIKSAQARQQQGELEVTAGQIKLVRQEIDSIDSELNRLHAERDAELQRAGAPSAEAYEELAARAKRYGELVREAATLEDQLQATIGDRDLDAMREAVSGMTRPEEVPEKPVGEIKGELATANEELESKRKQEHALQLMIAEKSAGHRSLNEIEEERSATEQRVAELEAELQAANYAAEVIEEVTRARHSRIAPQLASLASLYLKEITDGAYDELLVDRDLQISVRIPQTKSMKTDPEHVLSKGTVDQIYFALRVAMVQSMSRDGESVPMVLDDPFANYDDERLRRAMRLLKGVASSNQVLLFTCRDDVVRVSEEVGAPVLRL